MAQNLGADQHLAVPTKGQVTVHAGAYAERCPECLAVVRRAVSKPLAVDGVPVMYGTQVRPLKQAIGSHHPEWGTVAEIRWNSHNGETWIHCWEYGMNLVLTISDIAEVRWPESPVLPEPKRVAAALAVLDDLQRDPPLGTVSDVTHFLEAYAKYPEDQS